MTFKINGDLYSMIKERYEKIKNAVIRFCKNIWNECKDWRTVAILLVVITIVYSPAWGGYLLYWIFGFKWCLPVATAWLAFWAGPMTPFFPLCIGIALGIKKLLNKLLFKPIKKN